MRALPRTPQASTLARAAAVLVAVVCVNVLSTPPASAAKVRFGTQEHLQKIEDIDLRGPNGEALYLGYKYSFHSFIAPYHLTDDGYILGVVGQQRYFALDAALIERLQAQRRLPTPLPAYSLSVIDYLFGYALWLVVAGVVVAMVFAGGRQRRQKQAVPFAEAGLAHHRAGNLDAAIAQYGRALERHPKFIDVLMLRGDAHRARGEIDRAIADYSKIINVNAKNAVALVARGSAFEAKRLVPRAIDDYTRAIKSSKAPAAYFMRANAYAGRGDLAAAIKDYTAAIAGNKNFAAAYQNRALVHEQLGRTDLAEIDRQWAAHLAAQPA